MTNIHVLFSFIWRVEVRPRKSRKGRIVIRINSSLVCKSQRSEAKGLDRNKYAQENDFDLSKRIYKVYQQFSLKSKQ